MCTEGQEAGGHELTTAASRFSVLGVLLPVVLNLLLFGLSASVLWTSFVDPSTFPWPVVGGALVFLVGTLWFIPYQLTARVVVTNEGLEVGSIWGSRRVRWEDVTKIEVGPNYVGGAIVYFQRKGPRRGIAILCLSFRSNYVEVLRASVDAVRNRNEEVEVAPAVWEELRA